MLSEVIKRMMDLLKTEATYRIKLVIDAEEEVRSLEQTLTQINDVLNDAEKRRYKEKSVNNWLLRLQQKSYEMEDILDEWDFAILKLRIEERQSESDDAVIAPLKEKVRSFLVSSFPCLCFNILAVRHEIALKIENLKEQFDKLLKDKDQFDFVVSPPIDQPSPKTWRDSTSFPVVEVRGRDEHCSTLVAKLTGNGGGIQVVSIVGVGGLGKTTIAQLVYNHTDVEKHFDLRLWVCVSDPFDLVAIAKGIIESVKKGDSPSTNNLQTLWQSARDDISGKKFLLVLDDVWTEEYANWESLKCYLSCHGEGSKILVTTRNEKVAKIMGTMNGDIIYPDKLSHEDCWLLMRHIARPGWGERMESDQERREFEETGKKIAEKCDGLPLAARTLGSLLCTKSTLEKWKGVLSNELWKTKEMETGLFRHLLLSYNELSPTLKRCFSFCAVFPKDTIIDVEELIRYWMALGYLGSDATSSGMEDRGQEYFEIIAMHSLFQDFEKECEHDEKILYCKMHDIVHDFAKFLRKSSMVEATSTNKCQTCQALDRDPPQISTVNEFQSFFWDEKESPPILCDCLTRIRVLSLRDYNLRRIPQIMEKFIHLRWLNLSRNCLSNKEGLKIIFKLYNLKTLNLSKCSLGEIPAEIGNLIHARYLDLRYNCLKKLPKEIGKLIHLTHLDLSSNAFLMELPKEIGKLIRLTHLDLSLNEHLTELPREIENLVHLKKLNLSGVSLEKLPKEIGNLVCLTHLDLRLKVSLTELPWEIGNLVHLKKLNLRSAFLEKLPKEIGKLIRLTHLDLGWNRYLKELPREFGNLVNLRKLDLCRNESLEKLPKEIGKLIHLAHLSLSWNTSLTELPREIGNFICLTRLDLRSNVSLEKLPETIHDLHELRTLVVEGCGSLCEVPDNLAQLTGLSSLTEFKGESTWSKLGLLKNLTHLGTRVRLIIRLDGDNDLESPAEDVREAKLRNKKGIWKLEITFEDENVESWVRMEVMDALHPPPDLQQLSISRYKGSKLPGWMVSPLTQLLRVYLFECHHLKSLPSLGKLPCLTGIWIEDMEGLEMVGREFFGFAECSSDAPVISFPMLSYLKIKGCGKWKEWEDITAEEACSVMPCLNYLEILDCNGLTALPHRLIRKASYLRELCISGSTQLEKRYLDMDDSDIPRALFSSL